MRRITLWLVSTIAAVILMFSYRTSTMGAGGGSAGVADAGAALPGTGATGAGGDPGTAAQGDPGTAAQGGAGSTDQGGAGSTDADAGSGASTRNGTVDGSVAQTRWGPVQVRITVSGGKLTEVSALQVPNGNFRDQQINDYAVPILRQEALRAQSAQIAAVSGATVTSDGYRESLQAAIDAAHLG